MSAQELRQFAAEGVAWVVLPDDDLNQMPWPEDPDEWDAMVNAKYLCQKCLEELPEE